MDPFDNKKKWYVTVHTSVSADKRLDDVKYEYQQKGEIKDIYFEEYPGDCDKKILTVNYLNTNLLHTSVIENTNTIWDYKAPEDIIKTNYYSRLVCSKTDVIQNNTNHVEKKIQDNNSNQIQDEKFDVLDQPQNDNGFDSNKIKCAKPFLQNHYSIFAKDKCDSEMYLNKKMHNLVVNDVIQELTNEKNTNSSSSSGDDDFTTDTSNEINDSKEDINKVTSEKYDSDEQDNVRKQKSLLPIPISKPISINQPNIDYKRLYCIIHSGYHPEVYKDHHFFKHFSKFGKLEYHETVRNKIGELKYGYVRYFNKQDSSRALQSYNRTYYKAKYSFEKKITSSETECWICNVKVNEATLKLHIITCRKQKQYYDKIQNI